MDAFKQFWAAWPKRVKRQEAMDAFRWAMAHHNEDGQLLERMIATIAWQRRFYGGAQYLPDPNKWLLACRWEDENPAETAAAEAVVERAEAAAARKAEADRQNAINEAREARLWGRA